LIRLLWGARQADLGPLRLMRAFGLSDSGCNQNDSSIVVHSEGLAACEERMTFLYHVVGPNIKE
jgi:hypothetical protein